MRRVNANSTAVDEGGGREQGGARGRCLLGGHLPPAGPGGKREGRALRSRLAPALASEAWGRAGSDAGRWRGAARGAGLARGTGRPAAQPQDGPLRRERVGSDTRPETVSARARRPCQVVPFHSRRHQ